MSAKAHLRMEFWNMNQSAWDPPFLYLAIGFLILLVLLIIAIWSIRRHLSPKLDIECASPIDELIPSLAGLSLSTPVAGNSVEVLENGAFFDALLESVRSAKHSIHFETFLWKEGVLGGRLADALSEKARAGVKVRILLDAIGSSGIGKSERQRMEDA